jgi:succinyl-CoA synthetase alpha subunit
VPKPAARQTVAPQAAPSILADLMHRPGVIVQGITGTHGSFHTQAMLAAGTPIVAGVTPGRAGATVCGVPVFDTVTSALAAHPATVSVMFVPAKFAKAALLEAVAAGLRLIVCITEGIPVHDMLEVLPAARAAGATILGPNCPGLLIPGRLKLGIIPATVGIPGDIAVVSRSGTLTYEVAAGLTARGLGQRYIVGIGGDRLHGLSFIDCLAAFEADPAVSRLVLVGEIGGADEQQAADYLTQHVTKPVHAYVVGQSAPSGTQLGHAGAIMTGHHDSAAAKTQALLAGGAIVAASLSELLGGIARVHPHPGAHPH